MCDAGYINDAENQMKCLNLDRVLEAAVTSSWSDLMPNAEAGLIHVEYNFGMASDIAFLQVWSSEVRGFWHLVCTCCISPSGPQRHDIQFENGYSTERLAATLNSVMRHQDPFQPPPDLGRKGLLQIAAPSEADRTTAKVLIKQALDRIESREVALIAAYATDIRGKKSI
jgi:hypothetical protein